MARRKVAPKQWDMVQVLWEDAFSVYCEKEAEEFARYEPVLRKMVGFLLYSDEKRTVVAGTDDRKRPSLLGGGATVCDITVVPAGMVRNIIVLKEVE